MTLLVAFTCLASATANAQWQWLDQNGRKVFSDQPPPSDIPARNVLKAPGKMAPVTAAPAIAPANTVSATPALPTPALSKLDQELQTRRAKAQADALATVKADEQANMNAKAANCETARKNQATMESGVRISITNDQGERQIMDDAARADAQKKIRTVIEANCK